MTVKSAQVAAALRTEWEAGRAGSFGTIFVGAVILTGWGAPGGTIGLALVGSTPGIIGLEASRTVGAGCTLALAAGVCVKLFDPFAVKEKCRFSTSLRRLSIDE